MKLPRVTAERSLDYRNDWFIGTVNDEKPKGLEMAINIGCLMRCGGKALACAPCGSNLTCWAACAGPSTVSCATRCF